MNLESAYYRIKECLIDAYQLDHLGDRDDQVVMVKCRATELTRLYLLISVTTENSYLNLSNKDSLFVLIYDASNQIVTNPLSLPPALVLRVLHDRLYAPELEVCEKFYGIEETMKKWFVGYLERKQAKPGEYPVLPELRWSDLPNELFGLMSDS